MASGRNPLSASFLSRNSLFQFRLPPGGVGEFLRIHPGEARLLAWVTLIQAVMSFSSIMVNNVAQTAFLKRFGSASLPVVFMLEALLTLGVTALVGLLMERFSKIRVFTGLILFYGLAIGLMRLLIPTGATIVYPVLYILKSQAVGVLPILYWDILSDLFTIRQSKRLYTLISAGGIMGIMAGSFLSRHLAAWVGLDNVLVLFTIGMGVTALLNEMTEKVISQPMTPGKPQGPKKGTAVGEMARIFAAQWKDSPLLRYMVLLIAIPNVLLPILDFQFNVMVDRHFASEAGTLGFFSLFRGISNGLMFAGLMVSSRLIDKWGIPVCLLFHPLNYLAAFVTVMLRFDIIAAVYARLSTEMLKTVLNNPARAVLYNFFPEHRRSTIRLVLRGWIVRLSDFAGSGLLILISGTIDPRLLSLVALPLTLAWSATAFRLRSTYPDLLLAVLKTGQMDWDQMEAQQQRLLARDWASSAALVKGLADPAPDIALLSAQTLSISRPQDLARHLLPLIWSKPPDLRKRWLELLTPEHDCTGLLREAAQKSPPELLPEFLAALNRISPAGNPEYMERYLDHADPKVRFQAIMGLGPDHRSVQAAGICRLLNDTPAQPRKQLSLSDAGFDQAMAALFSRARDAETRATILEGMAQAGSLFLDHATAAAQDPDPGVRLAALRILTAGANPDRAPLVLPFLKDRDPRLQTQAVAFFGQCGSPALPALLSAISGHSRVMQQQAVRLLNSLGFPQSAISGFIKKKTSAAWEDLRLAHALSKDGQDPALSILSAGIKERSDHEIEILLRVLGAVVFNGHARTILRAVQSGTRSGMDLVIEMLETELHPGLKTDLIPLLEDRPAAERLAVHDRRLGQAPGPARDTGTLLKDLLASETDPWLRALCLYAGAGRWPLDQNPAAALANDPDPVVAKAAGWTDSGFPAVPDILTQTLFLRQAPFFNTLKIMELLPVAGECRMTDLNPGQVLAKAGQGPARVYLFQRCRLECQIPGMDRQETRIAGAILETGIAGEMPWIDGEPQLYTVCAAEPCQALEMPGPLFAEILSAHPSLAMDLSRHYSHRIRIYQTAWDRECAGTIQLFTD